MIFKREPLTVRSVLRLILKLEPITVWFFWVKGGPGWGLDLPIGQCAINAG